MHSLRLKFLEQCSKADIIADFLNFRVPPNGCFDNQSVQNWIAPRFYATIFSLKSLYNLKLVRKIYLKAKTWL